MWGPVKGRKGWRGKQETRAWVCTPYQGAWSRLMVIQGTDDRDDSDDRDETQEGWRGGWHG
jgi:hypothetical protein